MRVPEHFAYAYSGLEALAEDLSSGGIFGQSAGEGAVRWLREDARGSLALAKSAILAMRHEAAVKGTEGRAEEARATLRVLDLVERRIDPPEDTNTPPKMPVAVRVPEALRKRSPNLGAWRLGRTQILAAPGPKGWELSVSHPARFPHFEELMLARGVTGERDKWFAALIPAASAPPAELGRGGYVVDVVEGGAQTKKAGAGGGAGDRAGG